MENNIIFRRIEKSDYAPLQKIIKDTWGYEKLCSPKTADKMAKIYLASCLANQTYTCVSVVNNEPVGVIMGRDLRKGCNVWMYLPIVPTLISMLLTKEGRHITKIFAKIERIDKNLLSQANQTYDGELAFFVLKDDQRGKGIGQKLFAYVLDYMAQQSVKNFYLYTDSSCNYGFYEHQGMKRVNEKVCKLLPDVNDTMLFYLYAYDVK